MLYISSHIKSPEQQDGAVPILNLWKKRIKAHSKHMTCQKSSTWQGQELVLAPGLSEGNGRHTFHISPAGELTNDDNSKVWFMGVNSREEDVTCYKPNV